MTGLSSGTKYRLTLCEADINGVPMLQPNQVEQYGRLLNNTNIVEAVTRDFVKTKTRHGDKKLKRWEVPASFEDTQRRLQSEREREDEITQRPRRFKDRHLKQGSALQKSSGGSQRFDPRASVRSPKPNGYF